MTISTSTSRSGPYAGAGTTGPFAVTFRFLENSHLKVVRTSAAAVETILVLGLNYTVTGAGGSGGAVTLTAPLPVGESLTIARDVPYTQETDYTQSDPFPAQSHEDALDKVTMLAQQNKSDSDRALRVPEEIVLPDLPPIASRANMLLAFDSSGDPSVMVPVGGSAADVLIQLANTSDATKGAALIGYFLGATGSYSWDLMQWMRRRGAVSVLDFVPEASRDAALAGTYDCTAAINAGLAACLPAAATFTITGTAYHLATKALEFPPGRYKVTGTVSLSGYGATKKAVGLHIYGPNLTPVYAGGNTALNPAAATIIADTGAAWAADQAVLNLQHCHYCTISGIAVKGIYGTTKGLDLSNGVGWGVESVSLYQHKYGEYHNLSSGLHSRNVGISNCSHAALYLKDSGDSDIESPFINTCNQDYLTDANQGIGIYVATSNNSNIRGGKIEYCSLGIYLNNTQGINVTGVNFDCNGQAHIYGNYDSVSGLTPNSLQIRSVTITGCRFLAGGHLAGTLVKSHLSFYFGSSPGNVVITGNSFRKGSGLAFDENSGGAQPVGPGVYCVYIDHQGDATYDCGAVIDGNDMWNGSLVNTIGVNAPNGARVRVPGTNLTNLPNSVTGANVMIGDAKSIIVITAATYTVLSADRDLIANRAGTVTLTLPDAATFQGRRLGVRTVQAQAVVSATANVVPRPDLAAGTAILAASDGAWAEMVSDGTNWQIVASN